MQTQDDITALVSNDVAGYARVIHTDCNIDMLKPLDAWHRPKANRKSSRAAGGEPQRPTQVDLRSDHGSFQAPLNIRTKMLAKPQHPRNHPLGDCWVRQFRRS